MPARPVTLVLLVPVAAAATRVLPVLHRLAATAVPLPVLAARRAASGAAVAASNCCDQSDCI
jgi:hypothetical protein